jgi:type IV pilus assembly protein PilY1
VRISKDAIGIGSSGKCADGKLDCSRIVGEKTDKALTSNNNNARIFWREIPGLKTK